MIKYSWTNLAKKIIGKGVTTQINKWSLCFAEVGAAPEECMELPDDCVLWLNNKGEVPSMENSRFAYLSKKGFEHIRERSTELVENYSKYLKDLGMKPLKFEAVEESHKNFIESVKGNLDSRLKDAEEYYRSIKTLHEALK